MVITRRTFTKSAVAKMQRIHSGECRAIPLLTNSYLRLAIFDVSLTLRKNIFQDKCSAETQQPCGL
jgi:hypothetical protein